MFFNNSAQKLLMEKYGEMELPVEFLKKWLVARNEELTADNIDKEFEDMLPSLKWQLIKERVAQLLEVKFGEEDVLNHAKAIAQRQFAQYGITNMDDETITSTAKRILSDKNYRSQLVEQVGDIKLFSAIREAVTVENKKVSLDEFKALIQA
jgi:trigger factor